MRQAALNNEQGLLRALAAPRAQQHAARLLLKHRRMRLEHPQKCRRSAGHRTRLGGVGHICAGACGQLAPLVKFCCLCARSRVQCCLERARAVPQGAWGMCTKVLISPACAHLSCSAC